MSKDNTSITFLWHDHNGTEGEAGLTYFKNLVMYPEAELENKIKMEDLPYDLWSTEEYGWCMPFGEKAVAWEEIGPYIHHEILEKYNIKVGTFLYDAKYAEEISDYFDQNVSMEIPPIVVKQDSFNLGPVISRLQKDFLDGNIRYARNGLFESACINARVVKLRGKPYLEKPQGGKHTKKIDSVFSTLNAYKGHMFFKRDNRYNSITNFFPES
jgi:phage terminase large subunit-like protein